MRATTTYINILIYKCHFQKKKKVIFVHIPKTGGSSIEKLLNLRCFYNPKAKVYAPQHFTGKMLENKLGKNFYNTCYRFTLVRNPYTRMLSEYLWAAYGIKSGKSFSQFLDHVSWVVRERKFYQLKHRDHLIPQTEFIHNLNYIGRFEQFNQSVNHVLSDLRRRGIQVQK